MNKILWMDGKTSYKQLNPMHAHHLKIKELIEDERLQIKSYLNTIKCLYTE